MSAKWRAIQHRHRYTYSAVIFPQYFTEALDLASVDGPCSNYYNELEELVSLNSIYSQVNHAKRVASAFDGLLKNGDENSVSAAAKFYLETLFLENSLQLHQTLVSPLVKNKTHQSLICDCFRRLCEEYGGVNGKGKRFCVSRVALSMMSSPKLGYLVEIVEECAVLVGFDIVFGLNSVVSETDDWSRPSPIVMEQCQEALSCMYYLLQRFPLKFIDLNGTQMGLVPAHSNVMEMILEAIFSILKSVAFSRDCFVAAGVSFWSAVQVILSSKELGFAITEGIFCQKIVDTSDSKFENAVSKFPYLGNLFSEIHNFSVLSRLCLIRGILTAVSRTILNTQFHVSRDAFDDHGNDGGSVWTILYDGILPELCNYCENPVDSHFNFHSLTVMQICLQQIKTLVQGNHCIAAENYDPISENLGTRVLRIIWNNLEDPLNQTVKQVHLIFDLFLDIQSTLCWAEGSDTINSYLRKIASDLLRLGARCKGRYVPLASLTRRLGAKAILSMSPNLLGETCHAYNDDDVCCAATTFLKCFLENLRDECWSSDGIDSGYTKYRVHCLPPFLLGLASGVSKLRSNLNTYALPVLLEVDIDSIFPMLAFISVGQSGDSTAVLYPELDCMDITLRDEQKVAVLVSLLKVSRSLALTEGDIDCCEISSLSKKEKRLKTDYNDCHAVVCIKGIKVNVPVGWLALALTHMDESIRIDAAECLFLNPKTSSLPSSLELNLMKEAVPLNMRCCSTAFQMKWNSLFRKFFSRVRTALDRQIKQGSWRPLMSVGNSNMSLFKGTEDTVVDRADDLFHFMKWLSCLLFFSCYPSAPYERKIMAMEMILTMISVWSIVGGDSDTITLNPYSKGFTSPDSTLLLVGSIIDSWDRLRGSSFRILLHFPTPLPGISCPDMVQQVIISAKKLVCSARVRESDAGALTLRIIFRKYVLELGWIVRVSCNVVSFYPEPQLQNGDLKDNTSFPPTIEYLRSLVDWLRMAVEEGEKDLSEACTNSFVHGVLLTLRYTFEELDWNSDVVLGSTSAVKNVLEKLLELVMRITSLALWVVSADAWYLPDDMDGMVDDDAFLLEASVDRDDASVPASEDEVRNAKHAQDAGSSEQIVMVGCWLAMKEVSLLLGTIIRKIPLPTSDLSVTRVKISDNGLVVPSDVMLDLKQLETIGNHFVEVLLKMKHNGAIDKTRAGFTALCNRLLCSNDPRLCKLTDSWMEQLMERTVAKGQTVDDLLRRSAGIPAAFIALFLSEPEGTPKRLLPKALRWLIDVASKSLVDQHKVDGSDKDGNNSFSTQTLSILQPNMDVNRSTLKTRDEGVVPTVHAFNALRAAFNDTNLATDTSGFSAEALIISIRSFSSPYWEVRNSACLAYTALVRRMIGFLNVQKRESVRRAVTGLEFFHRYPSLHSFLLNELKVATEFLTDGPSKSLQSNLVKVVHPSLCPMLILLSRLKPSTVTSETGDELDPFLFMPFIRRCSTQSNLRVRVLASRALTGLVSNEKLPAVILNIASELPASAKQLALNSIHGMLLHLSSLLNNNCRNLADYCKKDVILNDLIQVLEMRSWIGRPRLCPCPILNGCFLKVLDRMLSIVRSCQVSKSFGSIRNLLWELSPECLDLDPFHGRSYFDPTIAELREQAVISYLNCVFHTSKELLVEDVLKPCPSNISNTFGLDNDFGKFHERLMLSMSDASYEVRIATLKWLLRFLKAAESGTTNGDQSYYVTRIISWSEIELQEKLLKLLSEEKNHKCVYYILKILFTWNLLQFQKQGSENSEMIFIGNMNCDLVFQFWGKLVFLYGLTRHAKTREILICCMGLCINRFTDSLIEFSQLHLFDCISFYVNLIKQQSDSAQPVTMRKAAAESIVASGLLEQAQLLGSSLKNDPIPSGNPLQEVSRVYAHNILDTWFTCIKLLEDEDIEIRSKLAVDVQKCFSSGNNNRAGVVPGQVEKVIELSFDHLSSIFGHWIEYFDYLSRWVFNVANYVVVRGGDLVRRVFDKEIDNHHEEKLLVCQICCSHLEKLPISRTRVLDFSDKDEPRKFLHEWRTRFCQKLISFANDHVGKQVEWIGGVGNHKDAFLPLYTNLLGFYAVSNCIFNVESEIGYGKSLLSDVEELGKAIYPFLRNPLISNLFLLVVSLHEKVVGETVDHLIYRSEGDESLWEGFDPYFLLG